MTTLTADTMALMDQVGPGGVLYQLSDTQYSVSQVGRAHLVYKSFDGGLRLRPLTTGAYISGDGTYQSIWEHLRTSPISQIRPLHAEFVAATDAYMHRTERSTDFLRYFGVLPEGPHATTDSHLSFVERRMDEYTLAALREREQTTTQTEETTDA